MSSREIKIKLETAKRTASEAYSDYLCEDSRDRGWNAALVRELGDKWHAAAAVVRDLEAVIADTQW